MLAYPVYLNEEPFKLTEKIGHPVLVFDPAVDGIELYGNVVVTTQSFIQANPQQVRALQTALRASWERAKIDHAFALAEVGAFYKGVSEAVLKQQIEKTVEFVSYDGQKPGTMDIAPSGRWAKTLIALKEAKVIGDALTFEAIKDHLFSPE